MSVRFISKVAFFLALALMNLESSAAECELHAPLAAMLDSSSKILRMRIKLETPDQRGIILCDQYEPELAKIALEEIRATNESDVRSYHFLDNLSFRIRSEFNSFLGRQEDYVEVRELHFSELHFDGKDLIEKQKILNRHLTVYEAKIKDFQIRRKESAIKSILRSFHAKADASIQKNEFFCGIKSTPCDFSITGEKISNSKLTFFGGIMREAVFIITVPKVNGGRIDPKAVDRFLETYNVIADAFVEKFGLPFGRRSSATARYGKVTEVFWFERYKEPGGRYNEWIFGDDEITIQLILKPPSANLPIHIEISMSDKQYYDQQANLEKIKKNKQLELDKSRDFHRRKKDF
jgi:hypothetical protein